MRKLLTWLLAAGSLGLSQAARAQYYGGHHCHCCCCCPQRDTTTLTERTNRTGFLMGATVPVDANGVAYGGGFLEITHAVRPRLSVGGYLLFTAHRASASSYGYEATAPAVGLSALAGSLRYQLLNTRRWRAEALGAAGLGGVELVDRDQQVYYSNSRNSGTKAATVAFRVHPLGQAGLGVSYKLARDFWLTSRVDYTHLAWSSGLGEPGEFSYWSASVGVAVPWGWH